MSKNQKINKIFIIACMLLTIVLLWQVKSFTDVPKTISYQGRLTDDNGAPLQDSPPYYTIKFELCKDDNCVQTPAWSETQTDIQLSNGLFSTILGKVNSLDSVSFDEQYYLRVTVTGTGINDTFPAQQLSSSAYAMNVRDGVITSLKIADNSITSAKIVDGAITNADISSSAAISQSKLNLSITDSEIAAGANISASKINTAGLNADTLDGKDSIDFATASHNHDVDYVNVTGDSMTGELNLNVNSTNSALKTTQSGTGYGVYGITNGSGIGVFGHATGNGAGMYARADGTGAGIYAYTQGSGNAIRGYTTGTGRVGYFSIDNTGSSAPVLSVTTTGTGVLISTESGAYLSNSGIWTNASSREYKKDIVSLTDEQCHEMLDKVKNVAIVRYHYKAQGDKKLHIGVIAEDAPDEMTDPEKKGMQTSDTDAMLIAAIQAQQKQIEALKAEIEILKNNK